MNCVFCSIISGDEPASIFYEDDRCLGFMGIRPARKGECMVIPKDHIDHFTDIPDDLAAHIVKVAQNAGRKMMKALNPAPQRIGYVVHGYGVAHAHLIIVPQHAPDDIISGRHLRTENGKIIADEKIITLVSREELDQTASMLKLEKIN